MIEYRIDALRQMIVSTTDERVDFFALSQLIERLMVDPEFQPGFDALMIARGPNAVPALGELRLLAPLLTAWSERRVGARWALVLPSPLAFGMASLVLEHLALSAVTARCFSHEQTALAWLATGRIDAALEKTVEKPQSGIGGASGGLPRRSAEGSAKADERRDSGDRLPVVVPAPTPRVTRTTEVGSFKTGEPR